MTSTARVAGADSTSISDDLTSVFDTRVLRQFVDTATRLGKYGDSLLELVVSNASSSRIMHVAVQPTHWVSDHDLVTWSMAAWVRPPRRVMTYQFRNMKSVDWMKFQDDIRSSDLFVAPSSSADEFVKQIDTIATYILDAQCPLQARRKFASLRRDNRWLSVSAVDAKRARRRKTTRETLAVKWK